MKKYLIISIIALLFLGFGVLTAKAGPSVWSVYSGSTNRLATSTDRATVGLQVNTTLTSPILPVDGFTQVDMNLQVGIATSTWATMPVVTWINYFSANGTDWFPEVVATSTLKVNSFAFGTSTSDLGQTVGTSLYVNRHFSNPAIGSRFMKTVFTSTVATSTIYADFTISNPNKN